MQRLDHEPQQARSSVSARRVAAQKKVRLPPLLPLLVAALLLGKGAVRAASFSDWQFRQQFQVSGPGLIKLSLPPDTLDAARADLADLRLSDSVGNEVPYLLDRPGPAPRVVRAARNFKVELSQDATVIAFENDLVQPLAAVRLASPANNFIKAVTVEGSTGGGAWKTLAVGQPVFRQPYGAGQMRIALAPGVWPFLRLSVDELGAPPVPFTGAEVETAVAEAVPTEAVPVKITERAENPGDTRLTLNLGAAHLRLASMEIESADPLFRRQITLAARRLEDNTIRERVLATDTIYRVAVAGQTPSSRLQFPLDFETPGRDLLLTVQNGDSPPLQIGSVQARRYPVYLVFLAPQTGGYQLFTGNRLCPAPRYDLSAQGLNIKGAPLASIILSSLAANPAYRQPDTLPQVPDAGAAIDVSAWRFRKPLEIPQPGVQRLDLDLDVLAHAQAGFQDLRLVRQGWQLPYVLEHSPLTRSIKPEAARSDDARRPKVSRWSLKLPIAPLPITRLTCSSTAPLFKREVTLYEEASDERGAKYRRDLGSASWVQSPERNVKLFTVTLFTSPTTETLFLETNNEDNPAIDLTNFEFACPLMRLFFKTAVTDGVFLYYGNARAAAPQYDLSLVAGQLLRAETQAASFGAGEQLKKPSWSESAIPGKGGVVFWAVLGVVVVALLVLIARLMPKPPPA